MNVTQRSIVNEARNMRRAFDATRNPRYLALAARMIGREVRLTRFHTTKAALIAAAQELDVYNRPEFNDEVQQ